MPLYDTLTETHRCDIIVYFKVNLKLLTKLINSAFVVSELRSSSKNNSEINNIMSLKETES